jgi:hypothetical protein
MKALCNSCLRVKVFTQYEEAHTTDCECGATAENADAYCACEGCQQSIKDLEKGGRNAATVSGMHHAFKTENWTPERGIQ